MGQRLGGYIGIVRQEPVILRIVLARSLDAKVIVGKTLRNFSKRLG